MKRVLIIFMCLCSILSFAACGENDSSRTGSNDNKLTSNKQKDADVKYGSYIKSDTYIVSTGQQIFNENTQTEYIYLEDDDLFWYTQSGTLWVCKNYNFVIDGNDICCTPKYNNGLVDIKFNYDESKDEITIELNDIMIVFSYHSNSKPIDDVFKNI